MERQENPRQPFRCRVLADAEPESAFLSLSNASGRARRPLDLCQDAAAVFQKTLAGRGQSDDPLTLPDEEIEAELGLKSRNLLGERRLRDPEPLCGTPDAELLGDRDEVAKLAQLHVPASKLL